MLQAPKTPPRVHSLRATHGEPAAPSVGSELHAPLLHAWPLPQLVHTFAFLPQVLGWMLVPETQVLPWQQPDEHELALQVAATHAPFWQTPVPQFIQTLPLVPHAVALVAVTHVLPWQQPLGQVVGEHAGVWQLPLMQASPVPQPTQAAPLVPHIA